MEETKVNLSFMLPVSQAESVLAFVRKLESTACILTAVDMASGQEETTNSEDRNVLSFEPVPLSWEKSHLKYLLDSRFLELIRFIVRKDGRFYNDELAAELGVNDPETSSFLGHLTRKLRKTGIRAEGFRGANWYSKIRNSGRTLITARRDVLASFNEALDE